MSVILTDGRAGQHFQCYLGNAAASAVILGPVGERYVCIGGRDSSRNLIEVHLSSVAAVREAHRVLGEYLDAAEPAEELAHA